MYGPWGEPTAVPAAPVAAAAAPAAPAAPVAAAPVAAAAGPVAPVAEPAAPSVPRPGTIARHVVNDPYGPHGARDREQVLVVTGADVEADGTVKVRALPVGYADDAGAFAPEVLTWQGQ